MVSCALGSASTGVLAPPSSRSDCRGVRWGGVESEKGWVGAGQAPPQGRGSQAASTHKCAAAAAAGFLPSPAWRALRRCRPPPAPSSRTPQSPPRAGTRAPARRGAGREGGRQAAAAGFREPHTCSTSLTSRQPAPLLCSIHPSCSAHVAVVLVRQHVAGRVRKALLGAVAPLVLLVRAGQHLARGRAASAGEGGEARGWRSGREGRAGGRERRRHGVEHGSTACHPASPLT